MNFKKVLNSEKTKRVEKIFIDYHNPFDYWDENRIRREQR